MSPVASQMIATARRRAVLMLVILAALVSFALCALGIITAAEVASKSLDAAIGMALAVRAVRL